MAARWGSGAGEVDDVRIDAATNTLQAIEYEHSEIHAGCAFTAHFSNTVTNNGEMTVIAFNTPDTTKWAHLTISVGTTGVAYIGLYENPSIDVDEGTQLTIYNRNRNSAVASTLLSIETAPVANKLTSFNETQAADANITTTTELAYMLIGAWEKKTVGGNVRGVQEWVLKQDQQYAILVLSGTDDTVIHSITLDWYEHTDKN